MLWTESIAGYLNERATFCNVDECAVITVEPQQRKNRPGITRSRSRPNATYRSVGRSLPAKTSSPFDTNLKTKQRRMDPVRWGLVQYWAKDPKITYRTINARVETVVTAPSYREAFKRRRCLIPAGGFYEWKKVVGRSYMGLA
jgi:hypothetical protein